MDATSQDAFANPHSWNLFCGIRLLAKEKKRSEGIPYQTFLEQFARQVGYSNWAALKHALESDTAEWATKAIEIGHHPNFGPVTAYRHNVRALRPNGSDLPPSSATIHQFQTNEQALTLLFENWGRPGFVEPMIMAHWTPEPFDAWPGPTLEQEYKRRADPESYVQFLLEKRAGLQSRLDRMKSDHFRYEDGSTKEEQIVSTEKEIQECDATIAYFRDKIGA